MRTLPTLEDITKPIACTCGNCGGRATIYPYPQPNGSCVCVNCTPVWFGRFVSDMTDKMRSGKLPLESYK